MSVSPAGLLRITRFLSSEREDNTISSSYLQQNTAMEHVSQVFQKMAINQPLTANSVCTSSECFTRMVRCVIKTPFLFLAYYQPVTPVRAALTFILYSAFTCVSRQRRQDSGGSSLHFTTSLHFTASLHFTEVSGQDTATEHYAYSISYRRRCPSQVSR